jgi:hypothetical protein
MESAADLVGLGGLRWCGRLTGQAEMRRLMTLGFCLGRRSASGWARISSTARSWAAWMLWGGKSRPSAGRAAGGAETARER